MLLSIFNFDNINFNSDNIFYDDSGILLLSSLKKIQSTFFTRFHFFQ